MSSRQRIAIIGLGLIGGSLGLFFKKRLSGYEVIGLSRSQKKLRAAKAKRAIDWGSTKPRDVLSRAGTVFICTPVTAIPFWIDQAERWAPKHCLVTDVGSTKEAILRWVEKRRLKNVHFVGSHPMAGSHRSGIEAASEDLFDGSITFVTRTARTHRAALKKAFGLWKKISRRVIVLKPEEHDEIVAQISHVPHAVAAFLVLNASRKSLGFAGPGFMDATRIAQGDPLLWRDILVSNRAFMVKYLEKQQRSIRFLLKALKSNRPETILSLLSRAAAVRSQLPLNR